MFHEEFRRLQMIENKRTLEVAAERARWSVVRQEEAVVVDRPVALRLCRIDDDPALERLALLEGRLLPQGRFVVAEVDGALVAAVPLHGGAAFADPFEPTAHLLPLLRLQAAQLVALTAAPVQPRLFSLRRVAGTIRG